MFKVGKAQPEINEKLLSFPLKDLFNYVDGKLFWKSHQELKLVRDKDGKSFRNQYAGREVGCLCGSGYMFVKIRGVLYQLHRIVFALHHGYLPNEVDHIDGNPLNNKIENLREASRSQNLANTKLSKANTTGVKGVTFNKRVGKFQAYLTKEKKRTYLGSFNSLEEAEQSRKAAFERAFGEYANHGQIAAGHRIDNDMGDDSHIENHVSPNCKKFDKRVK